LFKVDDGTADLNLDEDWKPLMEQFRPEVTSSQARQLFWFLDDDRSGGVELRESVSCQSHDLFIDI
jgi:hypothetical protein